MKTFHRISPFSPVKSDCRCLMRKGDRGLTNGSGLCPISQPAEAERCRVWPVGKPGKISDTVVKVYFQVYNTTTRREADGYCIWK